MPLTNYAFADLITFTRSTTATFVGSNGLIQSAAINAPRFDFDPVTLAPLGILIEEQRVNLLTYSAEFNNAAWVKGNSTVTANATTSPDGTVNADKLIGNTTAAGHQCQQVAVASATLASTYTFSTYIKAAEYGFAFIGLNGTAFVSVPYISVNLSTGAVATTNGSPVSSSAVAAGNGWFRVTVTGTTDVAAGTVSPDIRPSPDGVWANRNTAQDGVSGIFIWGAQAEASAFPTSYIPTVASTVTRAPDVAVMTGTDFSPWYNQNEGTIIASWSTTDAVTSTILGVFGVTDGTANERIQIRRVAASNAAGFIVADGGVTQYIDQITASSGINISALAYRVNDFIGANNGTLGVADTSGTLPTVTQADIGFAPGLTYLNGHLRNITYYPTRLTNAQLQALTA